MRPALALIVLLLAAPAAASPPDGGRRLDPGATQDTLTPEQDRRIVERVARNIEQLRAEGRLPASVPPKVSGLAWPLGPTPGPGLDYQVVTSFVDLDPAYPNKVRDYACGARSYDRDDGYNHRGTDYVLWPFPWDLMDRATVDILAAAPGTLIEKSDGAFDRSCNWDGPDVMNYVIILHADGTIARYLHMKLGTVTTRPIGSAIAAGEFLGKVGSSGISKTPHLHFEVRASNAVNAPAVEPHQGACNASTSTWASQRPYRDPQLTRLSTHSTAPGITTCPDTTDEPNFKDGFAAGDPITFVAAYRDVSRGEVTRFRVLRPDNSEFSAWDFDPAEDPEMPTTASGAYWLWNRTLPADAPHGLWTYESKYLGQTKRHYFRVGATTTPINDPRGLIGAWYEPATSGQGLEMHWIENDTLLVFFYGHHDDGSNFFTLGIRAGRFDYGQEIEIPMHQAVNGRFNGFDPDAIQRPEWGVLRLTFVSCESAVAELDGLDGNKVLALERLGRMPGLACD